MNILDCDVHPYANSMTDVLDYVPMGWRERFENFSLPTSARGPDRYQNPTGGLRGDAAPPKGGMPGSDAAYAAEDLLDPHGITAALLLPMQGAAVAAWTDSEASAVMVSAVNDYMIDRWCNIDSRFKLAAVVSPHDPSTAAEEIRRVAGNKHVIGVFLPQINRLMGEPYFYPIYEAAQAARLPIVCHPSGAEGCYVGAPAPAAGIPRTYPGWRVLLSQIAQSNLSSLVYDGIPQRFPDLRVVFAEFGFSWIVPFLWRLDNEWQDFRYEIPWVQKPPSEYIKEFLRFGTQPIDEPEPRSELWELMRMQDAISMLAFSSDYPHWDADDPTLMLGRIPEDVRERIAWDSGWELFGQRLEP